jgi:hypothetical protein
LRPGDEHGVDGAFLRPGDEHGVDGAILRPGDEHGVDGNIENVIINKTIDNKSTAVSGAYIVFNWSFTMNKVYIQSLVFNGLIFNAKIYLSYLTGKHTVYKFNTSDIISMELATIDKNDVVPCFVVKRQKYKNRKLVIDSILVDENCVEIVSELSRTKNKRYTVAYTELTILKYMYLMYGNFKCFVYYIKNTREFLFSRYSLSKIKEIYLQRNLDTQELDDLIQVEYLDGTRGVTKFNFLTHYEIYPNERQLSVYLKNHEYLDCMIYNLENGKPIDDIIENMNMKEQTHLDIIQFIKQTQINKTYIIELLLTGLKTRYEHEIKIYDAQIKLLYDDKIKNINRLLTRKSKNSN